MASRKRLRDAWGPVRGRSAVKAAAIAGPAKRAPAKKDTKSWCRGREGREHVTALEFRPPAWIWKTPACEWDMRLAGDGIAWECHHEEVCQACGKVLRWRIESAECPVWPGSEAQKAQAQADAAESRERMSAWRASRRPVINGPQSYRRRKAQQ